MSFNSVIFSYIIQPVQVSFVNQAKKLESVELQEIPERTPPSQWADTSSAYLDPLMCLISRSNDGLGTKRRELFLMIVIEEVRRWSGK